MRRKFDGYVLFLLTGSALLPFLLLVSTFDLGIDLVVFGGVTAAITLLFYLLFTYIGLKKTLIFGILLITAYGTIFFDSIQSGFFSVFDSIVKTYTTYVRVKFNSFQFYIDTEKKVLYHWMFLILLFGCSLLVCLWLAAGKKRKSLFVFTLFTASLVLIYQIPLNWPMLLVLLSYWFALMMPMDKVRQQSSDLLRFAGVILLSVMLIFTSITHIFPESSLKEIYDPVTVQQEMLDKFNTLIRMISRMVVGSDEISLRTAGNRYYTGAVVAEITRQRKEGIYLKSYAGGYYENSTWKMLPESILKQVSESVFNESYFWLVQYVLHPGMVEEIEVTDYRNPDNYSLMPYYLRSVDQQYTAYYDGYVHFDDKSRTINYEVYLLSEITQNSRSNKSYALYARDYYTEVPEYIGELFANEMQMKNKNELHDAESIYQYILSILKDYTYTLSPGNMPGNQDIVSYFLTENKRGYCVHFASAAALMFRYYGIPARYAEGYYVSAGDIEEGRPTEIIDSDAHAWVEIFDEELGWIPKEVTISTSTAAISPDDNESAEVIPPHHGGDPENNPTVTPEPSDDIVSQPEYIEPEEKTLFNWHHIFYPVLFILLVIGYIIYRRVRLTTRRKRFMQKDTQQAGFAMAHYLKKILRYGECSDGVVVELLEKNKYSPDSLNAEEIQLLHKKLMQLSGMIYEQLPKRKRFVYKYIKCYI